MKLSEMQAISDKVAAANLTLESNICKIYPTQDPCTQARAIIENPKTEIPATKGDKGDRGSDGRGVSTFKTVSGDLIVKYTDGATENLGKVIGKDGKTGKTGSAGKTGRGILSATVESGSLVVKYSDGTTHNAGIIVGPAGAAGAAGSQGIQGVQGERGSQGVPGIGVSNISVKDNGEVTVTYTDGRTEIAGKVIISTIKSLTCSSDVLTITMIDGTYVSTTVDCSPDTDPQPAQTQEPATQPESPQSEPTQQAPAQTDNQGLTKSLLG
jgi:hypothetical protein